VLIWRKPLTDFIAYFLEKKENTPFRLDEIESLMFTIGPGIDESEAKSPHGIAIESVRME